AFFDGEECVHNYGDKDGLHGSKRLAAAMAADGSLKQIRAMVLLDMIGDKDLGITLSTDTPQHLAETLFRVAEAQGIRNRISYFRYGRILDDHVPFAERGVPAINIIDFDYGPNNSFWHTTKDNLDNVSVESLTLV